MYPLTSAWAAKTAAIHGIKRWLWSVKSIAFCIVISNLERSRNRIYTGFLNFSGISEEVIDGFRWQLVVVKLFWAVWCYCLPPTKEESYVFARVRLSVCLSVCLWTRLFKKRVHGFGWNVACRRNVGTWTNWLTFEPYSDHSPDPGTGFIPDFCISAGYLKSYGRISPRYASKITQKFVHWFAWNVACRQMSGHGRTD